MASNSLEFQLQVTAQAATAFFLTLLCKQDTLVQRGTALVGHCPVAQSEQQYLR